VGHGLWAEADALAWGIGTWINGEIQGSNLEALVRRTTSPQAIFHLAGGSSVGTALAQPREDFSRNVLTTAELLEWVRLNAPGARVILVSSAAIYGTAHEGPLTEAAHPLPCSPYGFHKLMMEQLCESYRESYGLDITVVRLFSVYGAWLKKQLLWDLCSRLMLGTGVVELGGSGDELRDWTDVRDVARALTFLLSPPAEPLRVINVATGVGTSVRRIAEIVLQSWDAPREVRFTRVSRSGDPFSLVADIGQLLNLGFSCTIPIEQGIGDYVTWFRQEVGRSR
jgi:UDP-glucose 4-epimerase